MKVYLYGNCQATALMKMIGEDHPDWSLAAFDVSTWAPSDDQAVDAHLTQVGDADIVIAQVIGAYKGNPALSSAALRAAMRPGASLISFPSIVFEGTHGAFTYLPNRLPGFHMDYHNSHTIERVLRLYDGRDGGGAQNAADFYTRAFVEAGIDASVAALRQREGVNATTIRIADVLEEHGRRVVLMNSVNHPGRFILSRVLNRIYAALGLPGVARAEGVDHLPYPFIPPLPGVLAALGIADERPCIAVWGRSWTREAYLRQSLGYYSCLPRQALFDAFAGSRGLIFLQAYHDGPVGLFDGGARPGADCGRVGTADLVAAGFAALLKRAPNPVELERHCAAVHALGLADWFSKITHADEFAEHYRAVD